MIYTRMKRFLRWLLIILGILFLLVLVVPLLIPVPPLQGTVSVDELADPDSKFIEVKGLKIHYKITGQGQTAMILLHGFASSVYSWREVMEPLSQLGTVVAFDRPAFGLTERPMQWSDPNPYGPDFQTELTVALMDKLGIQKAILIGNSAGGAVATLTTLRYPERVQALVLVDAAIYSGGPATSLMRFLYQTPQMNHIGPLIARQIQRWGRQFGESAWHDPTKLTEEIWAGYSKPTRVNNWDRALWYFTAASRDLRLGQQISLLKLPVLVITGDDDRIVPTTQSLRLANEIPGAELAVIANSGHVPHEEQPTDFLRVIIPFIEKYH